MLAEAAKHPCNETLVFCAEKHTIMLYFMAIMQQHMHTPMCFTMENDTNTLCFTMKMTLWSCRYPARVATLQIQVTLRL